MENSNQITITPIQAIAIVQQKLGRIPFTIEQDGAIGQPLRECIVMLEQLRAALSAPPPVSAQPEGSAEKKPAAKAKVVKMPEKKGDVNNA